MKDNRTGQRCEHCNSHIIVYRKNKKIVYECSYCGRKPDELDSLAVLSEVKNYEEA